jgi:hypothetical protein
MNNVGIFGPRRYEAEWQKLLAKCPSWATEQQWAAAIFGCRFGCRDLFGEWGAELLRLNWQPENIFDRWHGLAWFLNGGGVAAIGPCHAFFKMGAFSSGGARHEYASAPHASGRP